jgi:hypothetical protein
MIDRLVHHAEVVALKDRDLGPFLLARRLLARSD